jgi:hypothetical protein
MAEESIDDRVARFKRTMDSEFQRAAQGNVINLTTMMIEAESIHQVQNRRRRGR